MRAAFSIFCTETNYRPGNHTVFEKLDPGSAFTEEFATAHAAMLLRTSDYIDTSGPNQENSTWRDIETDSSRDSAFFTEDGVRELLWDLYDGKSAEPGKEDKRTFPPPLMDR